MKRFFIITTLLIIGIASYAGLKVTVDDYYPPTDCVVIIHHPNTLPNNIEHIGTIEYSDMLEGYGKAIKKFKVEAKKKGADIIYIVQIHSDLYIAADLYRYKK